ncbi:MAG TPA: DNA-3-methyladenine glycosylase, partial [Thermoplasmata archaeon]|nr:DNA-3-methyladenine glycosylase [Thermoplasmata archaeon]
MRPRQAPLKDPGLRARFSDPLPRAFYERPTAVVARALIGRWMVVRSGRSYHAARIVETEAYVGRDPASHAFRGPTRRNASMFGAPGTLYVYRIHQVHCANAVTRTGQAVLLRAAEPLDPELPSLSGPGRLCRRLGLTRDDDGSSLVSGRVRIVLGDPSAPEVVRAPRVGITRAVERPLRFLWR